MYDFFYLFKGKKKNFISLYPNWWFCFPASKTHKLILLCPWAGCWSGTAWEGKLHFLYNFTPKLIANTPHQLLESPCLHLQPQERIPGTHNIPESSWGCRDAQTKVSGWPELSSLGWNSYRVRGVLKKSQEFTSQISIPVIIVCCSFNGLPDFPKMRPIIFADIFHHNLPKLINPHFPTKPTIHLPLLLKGSLSIFIWNYDFYFQGPSFVFLGVFLSGNYFNLILDVKTLTFNKTFPKGGKLCCFIQFAKV